MTTFWGRLAAGQAIVGTDTESAIFYWNAAAEAIYGWTADEAIGRQAVALFKPLGGWDPIDDEGVALLPTGHPWTGEMHVQTKSGDPIPVLLTYSEHPAPQPHRSRSSTSRRSAGVSKLGSFEVNLDTGEITRSDELSRILGHEPGMVMASEFEHIHPEDPPATGSRLAQGFLYSPPLPLAKLEIGAQVLIGAAMVGSCRQRVAASNVTNDAGASSCDRGATKLTTKLTTTLMSTARQW